MPITISGNRWAWKLYVFQPIVELQIDGVAVPIRKIQDTVYRGVSCKLVKFKFKKLNNGPHELVMKFDPAFDSINTHTARAAGQDVNGDGQSAAIYSADGVSWSTDYGVDLIYELVGI